MRTGERRIILVDTCEASRAVMVRRLTAQGYAVEPAADPVTGADLALCAPPAAVIADLWMPGISGVQLCRLLRAEPATADVPVVLRGDDDDPRSRFWAERAGAAGYVRKGRMGELGRVLSRAVSSAATSDGFFMQLGGDSVDIRDRIARCLDAALFDSVIAAEVRALAACGSFDQLFDLFAQFLCQVIGYRWLALATTGPDRLAIHHHPEHAAAIEQETRLLFGAAADALTLRVVDEDASSAPTGPAPISCGIPFAGVELGTLVVAPSEDAEDDTEALVRLVARELGGPLRMAALMDEQRRLAHIDPLTQLRNRRAFLEQATIEVARAVRYELPLSVLLLDVDHFKAINDGYGHSGGDQTLSALGVILPRALRVPDLPARWGGEEFIVMLPNTDDAGARVAAERIRQTVADLNPANGQVPVSFTVSIGCAVLRAGESLDSLVDRADRAMYSAKTSGRNRVCAAETLPSSPAPALVAVPHGPSTPNEPLESTVAMEARN